MKIKFKMASVAILSACLLTSPALAGKGHGHDGHGDDHHVMNPQVGEAGEAKDTGRTLRIAMKDNSYLPKFISVQAG